MEENKRRVNKGNKNCQHLSNNNKKKKRKKKTPNGSNAKNRTVSHIINILIYIFVVILVPYKGF